MGDERETVRDAFAALGHEIRLDILLALLDDWVGARTTPRSYAELMDAVGMADSGKFNYHLGELRGTYVRKVEDGYVPTAAATALYRAALAHNAPSASTEQSLGVDSTCPCCGGELAGSYEHGFVSVACEHCEDWPGFTYPFPERGVASAADPVVAATERARRHVALARTGQCPFCAGPTTVEVRPDAVAATTEHGVEITCSTCSFVVGAGLLWVLRDDPDVAAVLADAGVDTGGYEWEMTTPTARVETRDPLRVALTVRGTEGTARLLVDGDASVYRADVEDE